MKDGFGEITEEITDERKDYISYKMEIILKKSPNMIPYLYCN